MNQLLDPQQGIEHFAVVESQELNDEPIDHADCDLGLSDYERDDEVFIETPESRAAWNEKYLFLLSLHQEIAEKKAALIAKAELIDAI